MTAQQLENEILFQASIAPFREMNRNGIITDEDLEKTAKAFDETMKILKDC